LAEDADARWGLLVLNKPCGVTSHTAVRRAARALGADRAGHAGTLDPLATGVLLVGLGRATRLLEYLVGHEKAYRAHVRLGERRDTLDREGRLLETRPVPPITPAAVAVALDAFRGIIEQVPPVHSAVKVRGRPLHRRARAGEAVEPPPRTVEIRRLDLVDWSPPDLILDVVCSKGTYIRSLARDLGDALGTGGTLWGLTRTRSGPFSLEEAVSLEELEAEGTAAWTRVLPAMRMVQGLGQVTVGLEEAKSLISGLPVECPEPPPSEEVAVLDSSGRLLAVARSQGAAVRPVKVFQRVL
jgi:tRNA pseudouridine55 synthase